VVDLQGRVRRCNKAYATFVGRKPAEVLGAHCCALLRGKQEPPPDCPLARLWATSAHQDGEFAVEDRWVRIAADPLLDDKGTIIGAVEIVSDITEQKQAEAALRESEERHGTLLANLPVGVYRTTPAGKIVEANAALAELLGFASVAQLQQANVKDLYLDPGDRVQHLRRLHEAPDNFAEFQLRRHDGRVLWVRDHPHAVADERGEVAWIDGVVVDITERKRIEEELWRHQERLEEIVGERTRELEAANERLVEEAKERARADEIRTAIYEISEAANQAESLERLYVSIHAIVGRLMEARNLYIALYDAGAEMVSFPYYVDEETPPPAPRQGRRGLTEYVLRTGKPLLATPEEFDELVQRGEVQPSGAPSIDWLGVPLTIGGRVIGALAVQTYTAGVRYGERDKEILTFVSRQIAQAIERKRAEEALRASERRFRDFVDHALVGVYRTTPDGRVLMANEAMARMFGFPSREAFLKANLEEWAKEHGYPRASLKEALARDGGLAGHESTFTRDDGTPVHVRESALVVRDTAGEIQCYEGTIEDMTEHRRLEEQIRQSQKMEVVGTLAGGVAHDFNNLLQAMLSHTQLLRRQCDDPQRVLAVVRELEQQVNRGASLTRQLLVFARRDTVKRERMDLNDAVREAIQILLRLIRANIALVTELASGRLLVEADRGQIEQVLMNLTLNASDAMAGGGKLVIRTGAIDHEDVWLSVEDTGHGIPDSVRDRIFEPFFTTKEVGRGTGLGLSVVHGIVVSHGGRIEVESEVGKGSTFRVVLPRSSSGESPPADGIPETAAELPVGAGERILVVEDEDGAREGLREILTSLGYEVVVAASREEAAGLAVAEGPDVLLTDLMLPGVAGPQLAQQLQDRWPALRVILMSGYNEDDAVRRGVTTGNVRFLQKPFDMDTLAREVRAVLEEGPPSPEPRR